MTLARRSADPRKRRRRTLAVLFLAALLGLDLLVRCCCAPAGAAPAGPGAPAPSSCPGGAGHCDEEGTPADGTGGTGCSCEPSPVLLQSVADLEDAPRGFVAVAVLAHAGPREARPPGTRRERVGWLSPRPDRGLSPPGLRSPPTA